MPDSLAVLFSTNGVRVTDRVLYGFDSVRTADRLSSITFTIRYDTIYDRPNSLFTCAQKLKSGLLSLAHGTVTKNKEKLKTKTD